MGCKTLRVSLQVALSFGPLLHEWPLKKVVLRHLGTTPTEIPLDSTLATPRLLWLCPEVLVTWQDT